MYSTYLYKALQLAEAEMLKALGYSPDAVVDLQPDDVTDMEWRHLQAFYDYARRLRDFVKSCTGPDSPKTVHELVDRLQLVPESPDTWNAENLVGKWLHRVLMGAFFKGVRVSTMKGEQPIYRSDLDDMVDDWVGKQMRAAPASGGATWWGQRLWQRFTADGELND